MTKRVPRRARSSKPNLVLIAFLVLDIVVGTLSFSPALLTSPLTSAKPIMTSVGQLTRQISALEISSKPNTTGSRPPTAQHQKKPSQTNVSKLLSKYAAPNPFQPTPNLHKAGLTASLANKQATTTARPPSPARPAPAAPSAKPAIDIGRYDGGFEIENETRGAAVTGEAAEELALDSSVLL